MLAIKLSVLLTSLLLFPAAGIQVTGTSRAAPPIDPATCLEAVVFEPRKLQSIAIALESAVLTKNAHFDRFTIVHGTGNGEYVQQLVQNSTVLREQRDLGTLSFRDLGVKNLGGDRLTVQGCPTCNISRMSQMSETESEMDLDLQYHDKYSRIVKSRKFWQDAQCDQMLLMQSDSVLCSNSKVQLSDFTKWEYVGPHTSRLDNFYPGNRMHLNGGISFRNRKGMLRCINGVSKETPGRQKWLKNLPEDSFFSDCRELKQPTKGFVKVFGVDSANHYIGPEFVPFCVHKPWGSSSQMYRKSNLHNCEGAMKLYKNMKPWGRES